MSKWSKSEDATLLELFQDSEISYEMISARLPGRSRGAVCGRIKRLGKAGIRKTQGKSAVHKPRSNRTRKQATDKDRSDKSLFVPANVSILARMAERDSQMDYSTLVKHEDLEEHHCRYVYGDPKSKHGFCGQQKVPSASFCERHMRDCTEEIVRPVRRAVSMVSTKETVSA